MHSSGFFQEKVTLHGYREVYVYSEIALTGAMNTCVCGNSVSAQGQLCLRCVALRILDLDSNATEAEIRTSYLTMVKVWHPDRFDNDDALRKSAEEKLRDVNAAYEYLTLTVSEREQWQPPSHWSRITAPRPTAASAGFAEAKSNKLNWGMTLRTVWRIFRTLRTIAKISALLCFLLFGRYTWIALDAPQPPSLQPGKMETFSKEDMAKELQGPKERFEEAVNGDLKRLNLDRFAVKTAPKVAETAQPVEPEAKPVSPPKGSRQQPEKLPDAPHPIQSYITVGSTKAEVLDMQGPPTDSSDDKLVYGQSEIYFKDEAVIGWKIDPVANPIRVKLWPQTAVDPTIEAFTYGSSRDVVLVVQGTPTAFSDDKFQYGGSEVYFQNHKVVRWKNDPTSIPLRVSAP